MRYIPTPNPARTGTDHPPPSAQQTFPYLPAIRTAHHPPNPPHSCTRSEATTMPNQAAQPRRKVPANHHANTDTPPPRHLPPPTHISHVLDCAGAGAGASGPCVLWMLLTLPYLLYLLRKRLREEDVENVDEHEYTVHATCDRDEIRKV